GFCGCYRLYRPDGSFMAHADTPVAEALKTGESFHGQDVIIERPNGSRITVCVHIDAVRDDEQKIVGVTNFFYDVTDRKAKEDQIRHQAAALEAAVQRGPASELARREADQRKNEFLAMLGHELRNPLSPIAHAGELLSRIRLPDSLAATCVSTINRQVGQLTRLVDDLLDI